MIFRDSHAWTGGIHNRSWERVYIVGTDAITELNHFINHFLLQPQASSKSGAARISR